MKPVFQTRLGPTDGNCFAACIASLLEISIEEAEPTSCANETGIVPDWNDRCDEFLRKRGLYLLEIKVDFEDSNWKVPFYIPPSNGYVIVSGKSPRMEGYHAVVGRLQRYCRGGNEQAFGVDLVHDPYPNAKESIRTVESLGFLIQFNPKLQ